MNELAGVTSGWALVSWRLGTELVPQQSATVPHAFAVGHAEEEGEILADFAAVPGHLELAVLAEGIVHEELPIERLAADHRSRGLSRPAISGCT